jgi:hypothetical protein
MLFIQRGGVFYSAAEFLSGRIVLQRVGNTGIPCCYFYVGKDPGYGYLMVCPPLLLMTMVCLPPRPPTWRPCRVCTPPALFQGWQ